MYRAAVHRNHITMYDIDLFRRTVLFAANAHQGQLIPATQLPYSLHTFQVWGEVLWGYMQVPNSGWDLNLMMQCALLHDVVEDTKVTLEDIREAFGDAVAAGVLALTKNETLPTKLEQMEDSLARIKAQPVEVWMVKIADRIVNLVKPPHYWDRTKQTYYKNEGQLIHDTLRGVNAAMDARLQGKIDAYLDL